MSILKTWFKACFKVKLEDTLYRDKANAIRLNA